MAYPSLGNPIWSCQYRLQGGRRLFFKGATYGLLAVGLIVLYHRLEGSGRAFSATALQALRVLAWVQAFVLVLGGAAAIHRALMRDYTTKMIESYRISPMSSATVVLGYMFGGPMQMLVLYGFGLVLGVALSVIGLASPGDWLVGNAYLLVVVASIWSVAVFAGVGSGKPGNLTALLVIGGLVSAVLMSFVPGLALLIGAFGVARCREFMVGTPGPAVGLAAALAASIGMTAFWSTAAAKRYRRPYLPALGAPVALVLVAAWCAIFVAGVHMLHDLVPGRWFLEDAPEGVFLITLLSPLLVAHVPAAAAVAIRRRRILGAKPGGRSESWSPHLVAGMSVALVLVMIVALARAGLFSEHWGRDWESHTPYREFNVWFATVLALMLAVWTVTGLLRFSYFRIGRSIIASLAVTGLWSLPPFIEHVRVMLAHGSSVRIEYYGLLLGCSPPLSISLACFCPTYVVWPGLMFQFAVAVLAHLLGSRAERALIRRRERLLAEERTNDRLPVALSAERARPAPPAPA